MFESVFYEKENHTMTAGFSGLGEGSSPVNTFEICKNGDDICLLLETK